jgi:phosphatidylglycerophosphatase A
MNEDANARNAAALATLFGIGRFPSAPGTAASLVALPIAWLIAAMFGRGWLMFSAVVALAVGTWACEMYSRAKGEDDPKECVIDELAAQWIVCAFAPLSLLGFFLAFVLFRLFDIFKPWPINLVEERVPGGLGIMADDVVAAVMASAIIALVAHLGLI